MPYLIDYSNSTQPVVHELQEGVNNLGRELDNQIILVDKSLSRHHARLTVTLDRCLLQDLNSLNSTFVNNIKVEQCQLQDQDIVRFGNVSFHYVLKNHLIPSYSATPVIPNASVTASLKTTSLPILKSLSLDQTHIHLRELLSDSDHDTQGTIIRLKEQNQEQQAVAKLKILLEVSKQLSTPDRPENICHQLLELLFQIMKVDRAVILLVNPDNDQLEKVVSKTSLTIPLEESFYSTTIVNYVREHGEAIITSDARADNRFSQSQSILIQEIQAGMCIPLKPRDTVIGVLYLDNLSCANIYSQEDLEFVTTMVNQGAISINNSQLYQKMQQEEVFRSKLERFFPENVRKKLKEEDHLETVDAEVTVLFADITGYTQLSSTMQPRQIIEMLNEYFTVMVEEIVFPFGGTLDKYMGDGLMAFWGAPYPQRDDADQAVKASIAMQKGVQQLNERWLQERNLQIMIHIGINTGKVAAGNIGSKNLIQYTTIGDTTNITSRICGVARGGEILISENTLSQLKLPNIRTEKLTPVIVKGKSEPLQLYKVLWQ